jgi:hypoxanthine phosphoribosyltransferase
MTEHEVGAKPGKIIVSTEEIAAIVARLGADISNDYAGRRPILVNLLKGGVIFLADLIRQMTIPHQIEFMTVSSYEDGTESSGVVRIIDDLSSSIEDRDVLIVEDVVDTGTTLAYIVNMLKLRNPASIEVCSFLRKNVTRTETIPVRYIGCDIPDAFVVGYGLDYNENYRNLPYIAELELLD